MRIGRVYKIIALEGNECYVGSTFNTLRDRFQSHKTNFRHNKNECTVVKLFKKYGVEGCKAILIKEYEVYDKLHLQVYETLWIKKLKAINNIEPSGGLLKRDYQRLYREQNREKSKLYMSEYFCKNKNRISLKQKEYYEKNKQKISDNCKVYYAGIKQSLMEKLICECGTKVCKRGLLRHQKTTKHLNKIKKKIKEVQQETSN